MKGLLLNIIFLYFYAAAQAQMVDSTITIKGSVVDSLTNKPLGYVTVALKDMKINIPVKSTLSKDDGSFEIAGAADKNYQLVLAYTGYTIKTMPVINGIRRVDVGKIVLSMAGKQLKEVIVTSVRPVIKREIDGISYDVSADPESVALNALDMMRKVPLLSVDASENIKLKGSSNFKILINGKESALVTKNPSNILRDMPATNIEKIEVITTPPAKYDAEGLTGIINIITKKNADQGYNIGIGGLYNSIGGPVINLNGTLKQGKFGLSAFAGYSRHIVQTTGFGNNQTFLSDRTVLSQTGTNTFGGYDNYGEAELSYEIDSLNLMTGSFDIYNFINNQSISQFTNMLDNTGAISQKYHLMNAGNSDYEGLDATINYQLGFKKDKNRLLTLSYKYSYSPNKLFNNNIFSDTINYQLPDYRQNNKAGNKEHTVQLDYVYPIKKLTLEAGGKTIIRNNFSDFQTNNYNDSTGEYVLNPDQSNDFNYHQYIYSLYNSYQVKWDKWTAKGGLRLEHTTIHANFVSAGSSVDQQYDNLIPSISLLRSLKKSSLSFGYTDRISRPGIYQLNPFLDKSNPKFISMGNPDLKPELNHSLELNYSNFAKSAINIGLSYTFSKNSIQNVTRLQINNTSNNTSDTVTLTTYQNLGVNNRLGLNINTNFTIIKDLTVSLDGQAAHVWLSGYYNNQFYRNDGYTGNAYFNAGYKFGKDYRFSIDGGIYSGDVNLQGKAGGIFWSSYVFSKTFLKKKATLALVSYNPYGKFWNFNSYTSTPDFYQSSFSQYAYRSFVVRFNYKFGKLNSEIKKNQRGINNDDTKGKSR